MTKTISAQEFVRNATAARVVIDVRTPDEFAYRHVEGAINIPLDQLAQRIADLPRDVEVYCLCQRGMRSQQACVHLKNLGVDAISVEGGLSAIEQCGGKVVQRSTVLPIMRQVQIAAGSLVVLGCVLAWLVHPAFIALAAFVGMGLIFAGMTGFCGMAVLLEKMPWNARGGSGNACCSHKRM